MKKGSELKSLGNNVFSLKDSML
jgi:hypothetical protein